MFKGSFTALITPFDNGAIDEDAFCKLVDFQIRSGTHGLVPVGTTGESPTLSHDEHKRVIELCVEAGGGPRAGDRRGRAPIPPTKPSSWRGTPRSVGADAALVVTPYYNKPTQEGLYPHFRPSTTRWTCPIIIYNIPPRIGDRHDGGDHGAAGQAAQYRRGEGRHRQSSPASASSARRWGRTSSSSRARTPPRWAIMAHGGHGCISVTANVAPRLCAEFQDACLAGDYAKALQLPGPADAAA